MVLDPISLEYEAVSGLDIVNLKFFGTAVMSLKATGSDQTANTCVLLL